MLVLFSATQLIASESFNDDQASISMRNSSNVILWTPQAPIKPKATSLRKYWQEQEKINPLVEIRGDTVWLGKERPRNSSEK